MFCDNLEGFSLVIPPCPEFLSGSYRFFKNNERHVTRVCDCFVLLFILENTLYFTEGDKEVQVHPGEWYVQVPGLKQSAKTGSPAPVYYYIHFNANTDTPEKAKESTASSTEKTGASRIQMPVRGTFNPPAFKPLFDLLESYSKRYPSNVLGSQSIFLSIVNKLLLAADSSAKGTKDLALRLMEYIAANYNRSIDGFELSQRFNFTLDYLTRIMKKHTGITPLQYIQQLRIAHAQELLTNTDYTQLHIANEVGYTELSVFFKAFRKQTGVVPGEWRRKSRGL